MTSSEVKLNAVAQFLFGDETLVILLSTESTSDLANFSNVELRLKDYGEVDELPTPDMALLPCLDISHLVYLLQRLIQRGEVNEELISNAAYLWSKVRDNLSLIEDMGIIDEPHHDFVTSAYSAFDQHQPDAAIVLAATAVEQCLNVFYRYVLGSLELLSDSEITEVIKSVNWAGKIGWLLTVSCGVQLTTDTRQRIHQLMELRNRLVHFKAIPSATFIDRHSGSYNLLKQDIAKLDFVEQVLLVPSDLSNELDKIRESVLNLSSSYQLAKQAATVMGEQVKVGQIGTAALILRKLP